MKKSTQRKLLALAVVISLLPCAKADKGTQQFFPPLQFYEWPESTIAKLSGQLKKMESRGHSVSSERDRLRLAHLYWILGRYDEALSLVYFLRYKPGISEDTAKSAEVLYMLVTASSQVQKEKITDAVISVAGAEQVAKEIRGQGLWEELLATAKRERFRLLSQNMSRVKQLDQELNASNFNGEVLSWKPIELLLGLLRPSTLHEIKLKQAKNNFQDPIDVPIDELKWLENAHPWAAASVRAMEQLDSELFDLDLAVVGHSAAEARRKHRRAQIFASQGDTRQALISGQLAVAEFKRLGRDDDLLDALDTISEVLVSADKPDTLVRAFFSSKDLIDLHERRMSRLGPDLGRYQVRHRQSYRRYRELLRKLWSLKGERKEIQSFNIEQKLVLQSDLMQLRSVRREVAMFRALSQDNTQGERARTKLHNVLHELTLARSRLSAAQQIKKEAREDHRTSEIPRMVEMLGKLEADDVVTWEFDPPGQKMSVSMEAGPYARLADVKKRVEENVMSIGAQSVGAISKSIELPSSWQNIISGMGEKDGILAYLEFGLDEPLVAAIIDNTGQISLVKLPSVTLKEVQSLVLKAVTDLATNSADWRQSMKRVAEILWEPLPSLPERLTIIPNLSLLGLPFEALPIEEGKYVTDNYIIRYALGLADGIGASGKPPAWQSAAILGAYEFTKAGLDSLPESRLEVIGIRNALGLTSMSVTPNEPFPRLGRAWLASTKEKVGILHVSTHMNPDRAEPMLDVLEFPDDEISAFELAMSPVKADLSIFSACNLLGNRQKGTNPVSGLAVAALANIGPKLVTSFWSVESQGTRVFMQLFHDFLQKTKDPERALAEAKKVFLHTNLLSEWLSTQNTKLGELKALDAYASPNYWASFALVVSP